MEKRIKELDCYEYKLKRHSIITASHGKFTRYTFNNRENQYFISKRQIDGCVLKNEEACDWLFHLNNNNKSGRDNNHLIFLELKDSDLVKQIQQIDSNIRKLKFHNNEFTIHARIVLTKAYNPDIRDDRTKSFIKRIELSGGTVDYRSQELIENKIK